MPGSRQLRILVSNPSLRVGVGGRDDYLVPLIRHLSLRHRICASVDEFVECGIPFDQLEVRGQVALPRWGQAWRFPSLWVLRHLTHHLAAYQGDKVDVMLTSGIMDAWAASRALPKVPVVLIPASFNSAVDAASYCDDAFQKLFSYWFAREAQKRALRQAACTVAFTAAAVEAWSSWFGINPSRFTVSPYGIDLVKFYPRPSRKLLHAELNLPPDTRILLAVGRLAKLKRVDFLVQCLADKQMPLDVVLIVAGDGPERGRVEDLARRLGVSHRLFLLGQRSDVDLLMNEADLFVHASRIEYYPIVFAQALASGLPVVCFSNNRVTNINDEIISDNLVGRVLTDEKELVPSVLSLLDDSDVHVKMRINARILAQKRYRFEQHYASVESVLKKVVGLPFG